MHCDAAAACGSADGALRESRVRENRVAHVPLGRLACAVGDGGIAITRLPGPFSVQFTVTPGMGWPWAFFATTINGLGNWKFWAAACPSPDTTDRVWAEATRDVKEAKIVRTRILLIRLKNIGRVQRQEQVERVPS